MIMVSKKYLLLIAAMGMTLMAAATNRFFIEDFSISPGETRTVSIMLDNETAFTAFQCDLYLPDGLTATNFALTERKTSNHSFSTSLLPEGAIRMMSYSLQIKAYAGNSGALVTFDVTASDNFTGPSTIALRNSLFTTLNGVEVPLDDEVCTVTLAPLGMKGDVNNDGNVSIADVTTLIDYLLGASPDPFNINNADMDENEQISIGDVTALIDFLLSNM